MLIMPAPQLLLSVFAKVETFGQIADTPFGVGYQLDGLQVAVSFFGHQVYFGYQGAVLVLAHDIQLSFARPELTENALLLEKITAIDLRFQN